MIELHQDTIGDIRNWIT